MKEVMAIIRMDKMNETKRALAEAGVSALTACKVLGRGKGVIDYRLIHGAEEGHEEARAQLGRDPVLVPKRLLSTVVPEAKAALVVETIIAVNQTGKAGDGKIFVLPILSAVRVRTGETDDAALNEMTE